MSRREQDFTSKQGFKHDKTLQETFRGKDNRFHGRLSGRLLKEDESFENLCRL